MEEESVLIQKPLGDEGFLVLTKSRLFVVRAELEEEVETNSSADNKTAKVEGNERRNGTDEGGIKH